MEAEWSKRLQVFSLLIVKKNLKISKNTPKQDRKKKKKKERPPLLDPRTLQHYHCLSSLFNPSISSWKKRKEQLRDSYMILWSFTISIGSKIHTHHIDVTSLLENPSNNITRSVAKFVIVSEWTSFNILTYLW